MSDTINPAVGPKSAKDGEYETIRIKKIPSRCSLCEAYADKKSPKQVAVLSCEGACLRGEISRQVANQICFRLAPEETVRICLGGTLTKDTGQQNLVRHASRVVAVEGCFIRCASRMMQGVLPDFQPEVILADTLYELDGEYFGMDKVSENQIRAYAEMVESIVREKIQT